MSSMEDNWQSQSLEELEDAYWQEPDYISDLIQKVLALRRTPLNRFSTEDLRLMISQGFALTYLVPLALERLQNNLFVEGDFYPGDLLQSVLHVDIEFWLKNRPLWHQLHRLIISRAYEVEDKGINTTAFLELS